MLTKKGVMVKNTEYEFLFQVLGGIKGITQNPSALSRFFLVGPEVSRLAEEAEEMVGFSSRQHKHHHELSKSVTKQKEKQVQKLKYAFEKINPFAYQESGLINIVTGCVVPDSDVHDILESVSLGQQAFTTFVQERIVGEMNLWEKMSRLKTKTWKSLRKESSVKVGNDVVRLKEDRALFARMAIVARSRPDIDIAESIGTYEFSCVSQSLFSSDGKLLPTYDKHKLMHKLEGLQDDTLNECATERETSPKALVVDAMAIVQGLGTSPIKDCFCLGDIFLTVLTELSQGFQEMHVIFDHYDVVDSLKKATRERRSKGSQVGYNVCMDSTPVKPNLKSFLSSQKTKHHLTLYLAGRLMRAASCFSSDIVVSTSERVQSSHQDMSHLKTSQEEADTIVILHAVDLAKRGMNITIFSLDTDVFILALSRTEELGDVVFLTGNKSKRRSIHLQDIVIKLGEPKARALPGFHAFTGSDVCGKFSGKGKISCWQTFCKAPQNVIDSFTKLGEAELTESTFKGLEEFVCRLYRQMKSETKDVATLRWEMFCKAQAEAQNLPPTRAALLEHTKRAQFQARIWKTADVPNPSIGTPNDYGWVTSADGYMPKVTSLDPAPKAVLSLINCACTKSQCSTNRCSCKRNNMLCTELCRCRVEGTNCQNGELPEHLIDDGSSEEESGDSED